MAELRWCFCWTVLLVLTFNLTEADIQIYYVDDQCGQTVDMSQVHSALLETSESLTYKNGMDCVVTLRAPAGESFYIEQRRFKTEAVDGSCFDYLEIYDGDSVRSPNLTHRLCGEITYQPVYFSDREFVTFRFYSDESAKDRGFSFYLLSHTDLPCDDSEFYCNAENFCIDREDALCDNFRHCQRGEDEASCFSLSLIKGASPSSIGLTVGVSLAGVVCLCIAIYVSCYCYKKYKWNQYLKQLYSQNKLLRKAKIEAAYPLTHHYQTDEYINKTRAERDAALVRADQISATPSASPFQSAREAVTSSRISTAQSYRSSANSRTVRHNSLSQSDPAETNSQSRQYSRSDLRVSGGVEDVVDRPQSKLEASGSPDNSQSLGDVDGEAISVQSDAGENFLGNENLAVTRSEKVTEL